MNPDEVEDALRLGAPRALGALLRRYPSQFEDCEEAVQEALLAAAQRWPVDGVPAEPVGWLVTTAHRRLIDEWRSVTARRRREEIEAALHPADSRFAPAADAGVAADGVAGAEDDVLHLMLLCCSPRLTAPSRVALTLRAVGGLRTAQIAHAFCVPESTMAQRISRAKATLRKGGARFGPVDPADLPGRLRDVLAVLYLIFTEGHTTTDGAGITDSTLTADAIRMTRSLLAVAPDREVAGCLALMLLTDARSAARTDADGRLVPLDTQDRTLWDRGRIAEGTELITAALTGSPGGEYQLQAAIAALHDEAPTFADTDWPQINALYLLLDAIAPSPTVTVNRAVAVARVDGAAAALELLNRPDVADHPRADVVRAHLYEMLGDRAEARRRYLAAARRMLNRAERDHLRRRAAELGNPVG